MKFTALPIPGSFLIDIDRMSDERGFFARIFCDREFAARGLFTHVAQSNLSLTSRRGMLRGMHLQAKPHVETKMVRCVSGAAYDVVLDLRPESPCFTRWHALELSATSHTTIYIPEGCAHGFQALTDNCELLYQMSTHYVPESKLGVLWDDPAFAISWPIAQPVVSAADRAFPRFSPEAWARAWNKA